MKIVINGQVFRDGQNTTGQTEITIGKSTPDIDFKFVSVGENMIVRLNRAELTKILTILDEGLL